MKQAEMLLDRLEDARDNLDIEVQRTATLSPALQEAITDVRTAMADALVVLGHFRQICDQLVVVEPGVESKFK